MSCQPSRAPRRVLVTIAAPIATLMSILAAGSPAAAETRPPVTLAGQPASPRLGSAFVDPAGFLMFGPRVGAEVGAGHLSGAIYGRWFDGGLLAHGLFLGHGDKFDFSYGAGARGRYYVAEGLEGLHFGVAAEYLHTRVTNDAALIATLSSYAIPSVEVGYRLALGRFYAGVAAAAGYAFRLAGHVENLPGGNMASTYQAANESAVYGAASFELGLYF